MLLWQFYYPSVEDGSLNRSQRARYSSYLPIEWTRSVFTFAFGTFATWEYWLTGMVFYESLTSLTRELCWNRNLPCQLIISTDISSARSNSFKSPLSVKIVIFHIDLHETQNVNLRNSKHSTQLRSENWIFPSETSFKFDPPHPRVSRNQESLWMKLNVAWKVFQLSASD